MMAQIGHPHVLFWWIGNVEAGGKWGVWNNNDDFGNFNFGATGAACNLPNSVLLAGAGFVEWWHGTSPGGFPFIPPNYAEKQQGIKMIKAGEEYYTCGCLQ
jgi:hypothetical protein